VKPAILLCAMTLLPWTPAPGVADEPGAAAVAAWDAIIRKTEVQLEAGLAEASLASLPSSARAQLERGDAVIDERVESTIDVPGGLVHHWRGRVLVRRVSLDRLLAMVRDPSAHQQEDVLDARLLERRGDTDRVYLKIKRSALITAAYNTEHIVTYQARGPALVTSRSEAVKIAELQGLGTPQERERPPHDDRGFLWRMNAYWRYEAVDDDVLVTLDSLTMSRSIPWAVSAIASPIVNRVARESVARTLRSIQARALKAAERPQGP
jgi:hypothetical protein